MSLLLKYILYKQESAAMLKCDKWAENETILQFSSNFNFY